MTDQGRRTGDAVSIAGDYQYRALHHGPPTQRAWHRLKLGLLDWCFQVRPGMRVLDVGCGSGVFANAMRERGAVVTAVDANPDAIAFASTTFAREGLTFREGLLDELAFPDASFDGASCLEVVEHVYPHQVAELLSSLHRVLVPGGKLLVTTPNYRGAWPLIEWAADRTSSVAKMDADQHITRFHRRSLEDAIKGAGFRVVRSTTYCTVAPFLAPLSERLCSWTAQREQSANLPFGNLLAVVAEKP